MIIIPIALLFAALSLFLNGYVASVLWGWFIVPLGVVPITYLQAVGISCVINVFLGTRGLSTDKNDKNAAIESVVMAILIPLLALLIGWLVK